MLATPRFCTPQVPTPPPLPARYELCVRLYRPRSASLLQTFLSWLTGMPAEFADPRFPAYGPGREGGCFLGLAKGPAGC